MTEIVFKSMEQFRKHYGIKQEAKKTRPFFVDVHGRDWSKLCGERRCILN